jgi:hypothetical protein
MRTRTSPTIFALLASCLILPGCFMKKEPRKATIIIPPAPAPREPQPLPDPPILASPSQPTLQAAVEIPKLPAFTSIDPRRPRPVRRNPVTAAGTAAPGEPNSDAPEEAELPAAPSLAPALQPILGQAEATQRNRRIAEYIEKARANVRRAERSRPSAQSASIITQVKTFLTQAEEARKTDLVRAENLAERAEVLSRQLNR